MEEGPARAAGIPAARMGVGGTGRPWRLRLYLLSVPIVVVGGLVALAVADPPIARELRAGAPWILALFIAEMFPIQVWRDIQVSLGFPTLMFIAALYEPATAGIFALIGSGDPREFTGRSDLLRSVFNRSQVAMAGLAASAVFHGIAVDPGTGPLALLAAVTAATSQMSVNMLLVGVAARLDYGIPLHKILRRMPIGRGWRFQLAYLGVGAVGAVLAMIYLEVGPWAVIGLAIPLVAMRYLVQVAQTLATREGELRRERLLQKATDDATLDRNREQERLASVLHDEISPMISSLTLVLELSKKRFGGQDPELEAQLDTGLGVARRAQAKVRSVIGGLLRPGPDPTGLRSALRELLDSVKDEHRIAVAEDVAVIDAPAPIRELLYGVAREATRNAVKHGSPRRLEVSLQEDDGTAVLTVVDDGAGFDPDRSAGDRFGLRLLRQRLETCGGRLSVTSAPGKGTAVRAEVPLDLGSEPRA